MPTIAHRNSTLAGHDRRIEGDGVMTYAEMMIDVTWHLFFFGFGMIAGALVIWLERVK